MKRFFFLFFLSGIYFSSQATVYTWTGLAGDGLWSSFNNWSPNTSYPNQADNAIIGISVNILVDVTTGASVNLQLKSLTINGNATVVLSNSTSPVLPAISITRRIKINTVAGLIITNGSTLVFDAINATGTLNWILDLTGAVGIGGDVSGNLYFKGTGIGNGNAYLDLYNPVTLFYANCIVKSTGVIKYFTDSGNTNSDPSGTYLTMQSGSIYEINKNGGSLPHGSWNDNSNIYITGATDNNGSITFSQFSYGNFYWNTPSLTTNIAMISALSGLQTISLNNVYLVTANNNELRLKTGVSATIYDCTVRGNLDIQAGFTFAITSSTVTNAAAAGILHVKGNITNAGTIKSDAVAGNTPTSQLELNGTGNQNITFTGSGNLSGTIMSVIMNGSGATLLSPITLPGNQTSVIYALQLLSGKIITTSVNLLTLIDNAQYTGGSTTSFIHGPMKKIGDDNFIFPVGKGSIYAPIGIVTISGEAATDQFTAEYLRTNPQSVHGIFYDVGMDHVSFVEYWTLNQNLGSAVKKISEYVSQYSFCKNLARTYVSRWNGSLWTNEGSTNGGITTFPPLETGTITSVNNLSAFGDFTLITDLLEIQNPLPIFLKDVNAVKNNNDVLITWELTACCSKDAKFEVERSVDKNIFTTISIVNGSETNRFYSVKDYSVNKGITYYRIKITDYDGKIFFSKIVVIIKGNDDLKLISISPSIVQSSAILNIALSGKDILEFAVTDISGKAWMKKQIKVEPGNNATELTFDKLPAGVYHLSVFGRNGFIKTIRFVKQ